MLRLSVLDQSPVAEGSTGAQARHNTLDLARLADGLGYHRYWVAEHHGGPSLAGPSPEALIGPIAPVPQRPRGGRGGGGAAAGGCPPPPARSRWPRRSACSPACSPGASTSASAAPPGRTR